MREKLLLIFMSVLLLPILGTSFVVTAANYRTTLVMGTTDSVQSAIDPARAYDFFGWEIILNTGCGLVEIEPGTGDIVPSLATSWSVSDDGLNWTFNLRQGVYQTSKKSCECGIYTHPLLVVFGFQRISLSY